MKKFVKQIKTEEDAMELIFGLLAKFNLLLVGSIFNKQDAVEIAHLSSITKKDWRQICETYNAEGFGCDSASYDLERLFEDLEEEAIQAALDKKNIDNLK